MPRTKNTTPVTAPETVPEIPVEAPKERKQRFLVADVGLKADVPFAFHVDGGVVRVPNMLPAQEGKEPMLVTSIAIGMGCWAMIARAKGEAKPADEGDHYIGLKILGKLAEKFSKDVTVKGQQVSVSGELSTYTGKDKDGNEQRRAEIVVTNYALTSGDNAKRTARIAAAPRTYTAKDGTVQSSRNVLLLTGKICNLQPLTASSKTGTPFLRAGFSMVVPAQKVFDLVNTGKTNEYPADAKQIMNIVFFGQSAETKAKFLKDGMVVAVTGRVQDDVYEGKTSYTVTPTTLTVVSWPAKDAEDGTQPTTAPVSADSTAATAAVATSSEMEEIGDEDDEELPF